MAIYERTTSFSLLRGLIGTLMPTAVAYGAFSLYYILADDYLPSEAHSSAIGSLRYWYTEYAAVCLGVHIFLFLLTLGYRRRIINNWANGVWVLGLCAVAFFAYRSTTGAGLDIASAFALPSSHSSQPIAPAAGGTAIKLPGPPVRSNLLSGSYKVPDRPTTVVMPDRTGVYMIRAGTGGTTTVNFEIAPDSELTTIGYERLADFSSLQCRPAKYATSGGNVDGCSAVLPHLDIGDLRLNSVPVAFLSTQAGYSFLGADVLRRLGYKLDGTRLILGTATPR